MILNKIQKSLPENILVETCVNISVSARWLTPTGENNKGNGLEEEAQGDFYAMVVLDVHVAVFDFLAYLRCVDLVVVVEVTKVHEPLHGELEVIQDMDTAANAEAEFQLVLDIVHGCIHIVIGCGAVNNALGNLIIVLSTGKGISHEGFHQNEGAKDKEIHTSLEAGGEFKETGFAIEGVVDILGGSVNYGLLKV